MQNIKKGFTLVEVLIVVVIIAILASLIVPRMLAQTDKANAAEAIQIVGVIKRAAERLYDFTGSYNVPGNWIYSAPSGTSGTWETLGLTGLEKSKVWMYAYSKDPGNSWSALALGAYSSYYVFYKLNADGTDSWNCDGTLFKERKDTGGNVIGCTI